MSKLRISPCFNTDLESHKKAVQYINSMGRAKADYIARAILFYEQNKNRSNDESSYVTRDEVIEIFESLITKYNYSDISKFEENELCQITSSECISDDSFQDIMTGISCFKN